MLCADSAPMCNGLRSHDGFQPSSRWRNINLPCCFQSTPAFLFFFLKTEETHSQISWNDPEIRHNAVKRSFKSLVQYLNIINSWRLVPLRLLDLGILSIPTQYVARLDIEINRSWDDETIHTAVHHSLKGMPIRPNHRLKSQASVDLPPAQLALKKATSCTDGFAEVPLNWRFRGPSPTFSEF